MRSWFHTLSLTQRLLAGALVWVVCSLLAAGGLLNHLFQQHVEQQLQKELNIHLQQLIAQTELDATQQLQLTQPLSDPRFDKPLGGMYWQINPNTDQLPSLYSRSLWDEVLKLPADQQGMNTWFSYQDAELGELYVLGRAIVLADEADPNVYQFWVAAQAELMAEALQKFVWMLTLTLALLGSVLVLGVWWQLRLGLKPLHQLKQRLTAVHEGTEFKITGQYPQEIQPLVSEFNRVLDSHDQVVTRARTQAGNLAHAIKTPLAVLANAAKQNDPHLAPLVISQVAAAQEQVDYQLSRARVVAAVKIVGVRTPVIPAVHSLSQLLQRVYEPKTVQLDCSPDASELYFKGEAQDLHELLGNVLDNAYKWCQSQIKVTVSRDTLADASAKLHIWIDDDGPGLAPDQYECVFKRGVRADERQPGSGLGLSIVANLVQLYGGEVKASRSPLGGVRVAICLL